MNIGTNQRIGVTTLRYGFQSQLALVDCTSSRRSTVLCALSRATEVTTEYQRDSSSKRPVSSVVLAARSPARTSGYQRAGAASRAARPAGGACGAPGPRAGTLMQRAAVGKRSLAGRVRTGTATVDT